MDRKQEEKKNPDLRKGLKGSLQVPQAPLAGGEPIFHVDDSGTLVEPGSRTPEGQVTHE